MSAYLKAVPAEAEVSRPATTFVILAIGGVYIGQTLVSGLAFTGLPAVLRSQGASLEQIGLVWLVMLPWLLKFLWSGAVERFRLPVQGRRRSRLIVGMGQAAITLLLLVLALQDTLDGTEAILVLGLIALLAATVDIACDAFAVEQLARKDRGWGNVAQVGGSYIGLALGGGLFLVLYERIGWTNAVLAMACILAALSLPFLAAREDADTGPRAHSDRPSLRRAFGRPIIRLGLVITVLFEIGGRLVMGMTGPFLIDAGFSAGDVGALYGVGGSLAGLGGTFLGGLAFRWLGELRALHLVLGLNLALVAGLALAVATGASSGVLLLPLLIAISMASAAGFVVLFATLMAFASPRQAGVDFTLFQCASAGIAMLGGSLGGLIAGTSGYAACFGIAATCFALAVFAVPALARRALRAMDLADG